MLIRDLALSGAVISISVLVIWEASGLPEPRFDPIGPAGVPLGVAAILIGLAAIVLVRASMARPVDARGAGDHRRRHDLAGLVSVLTIIYVGAMAFKLVGFTTATIAFVIAASLVLSGRPTARQAAAISVLAVILGGGGYALFSYVLYVDLP